MGKFLVRQLPSGLKFDLLATNGQVIATSETYSSEAACLKGLESVRTNSAIANFEDQTVEGFEVQLHPKFEMYTDKKGEFRFRLKAKNGQIIAVSEGYKTVVNCKKGIESVRSNAPEAPIVRQDKGEEA